MEHETVRPYFSLLLPTKGESWLPHPASPSPPLPHPHARRHFNRSGLGGLNFSPRRRETERKERRDKWKNLREQHSFDGRESRARERRCSGGVRTVRRRAPNWGLGTWNSILSGTPTHVLWGTLVKVRMVYLLSMFPLHPPTSAPAKTESTWDFGLYSDRCLPWKSSERNLPWLSSGSGTGVWKVRCFLPFHSLENVLP